jgi:ferritin
MISNILELLQNQYRHETSNSLRYYARASWARFQGFEGAASFFDSQAGGERSHADKVRKFIEDRNEALEPASYNFNEPSNFNNFDELFISALQIEKDTTELLQNIYLESIRLGDIMTAIWVQDLITEQVEEENVSQTILDRIASRGKDVASDTDNDIFIGGLLK